MVKEMATSIWCFQMTFLMLLLVGLAEMNPEPTTNNNNNSKKSKVRFVRYLNEENYQQFIDSSNVEIVYFQRKDSRRMQTFLREYENSAERLLAFGIYLGLVDCQKHLVANYCNDERSLQYAFGFRNGLEKIALPLDTLFDVDSIVASALHLSLIHNVPIIQTLSERKALEMKCKGRYNIVFSYQKALGTYEHRVFMELAYTFLDKYVFAMTISELSVQDFSEHSRKYDDLDRRSRSFGQMDPTLWIIYCQMVTDHEEECSQSYYYGRFHYLDVFHFVQSLDAPHWAEFPNRKMDEDIPYDPSEIHLLYVIINDDDKPQSDSMISTYKHLGQMFAGSVGVVFVCVANASDDGLLKLGLPNRDEMKTRTSDFAWKSKGQNSLIWKEDCDDLQQFILNHLRSLQNAEVTRFENQIGGGSTVDSRKWDENDDERSEELSELQQDDMVAEYVRLAATDVSHLPQLTEEDYSMYLGNNSISLILFYVDWDPNCRVTMETLTEIRRRLENVNGEDNSPPFIAKLNCFDWPRLCQTNDISVYPTIKIFVNRNNNTQAYLYVGLIQSESILAALKLYELKNPLLLNSEEEAVKFSKGNWPIVSPSLLRPSFVILVGFSSSQQNEGMLLANELADWLMGKSLIGYAVGPIAQNIGRHYNVDLPFLIVCKMHDPFQTFIVYDQTLKLSADVANLESLKTFIGKHQLDTFAQLSPANFPFYRQQPDMDLVIYFSPQEAADEDAAWTSMGKVAASGRYPHLLFTWMKMIDPLAKDLMTFYQIQPDMMSAVRINFQKGTFNAIQGHELSQPILIERWLDGTLKSDAMHTDKLQMGDWKPLHPGFDYLRLIDEDTGAVGGSGPLIRKTTDNENVDEYKFHKDNQGEAGDPRASKPQQVTFKTNIEKDKWKKMTDNQKIIRSEL